MKKQKIDDIGILIDEYDEMIFNLCRDTGNRLKTYFQVFIITLIILLLIFFLVNNKDLDTVLIFEILYFMPLFTLIFLIIYNYKTSKGINKILEEFFEIYKINQETSVIKNTLNNLGLKNSKISKLFWIRIVSYKQICNIFYYKMYLKYGFDSTDIENLKKELTNIRKMKRETGNTIVKFLKENGITSLILSTLTVTISTYIPIKMKSESVKMNEIFKDSATIIFLSLCVILLIALILPYIISFFVIKDGKKLQMQKLKVINDYIDNFKIIEITETIKKIEDQNEIIEDTEKVTLLDENWINRIRNSFGEFALEYLDIYEKSKNQRNLKKLIISMKIEKEFYEKNETPEIRKIKIHEKINKILKKSILLSVDLSKEIKNNFGEYTKECLKRYEKIDSTNNYEKKKKLIELLTAVKIEKEFYKKEKIFEDEKKEKNLYNNDFKITIGLAIFLIIILVLFWLGFPNFINIKI